METSRKLKRRHFSWSARLYAANSDHNASSQKQWEDELGAGLREVANKTIDMAFQQWNQQRVVRMKHSR
jgi:hypothetical protein